MGNKGMPCVFCKEKPGIYNKTCCASPFCSVACGKLTSCCNKSNGNRVVSHNEDDSTHKNEANYSVKELSDKEKWELCNNKKLVEMLKDNTLQFVLNKIAKSTISGGEISTLSQYVHDPEFMALADEIVSSIERARDSSA